MKKTLLLLVGLISSAVAASGLFLSVYYVNVVVWMNEFPIPELILAFMLSFVLFCFGVGVTIDRLFLRGR